MGLVVSTFNLSFSKNYREKSQVNISSMPVQHVIVSPITGLLEKPPAEQQQKV